MMTFPKFGRYEIKAELGRGGMATVYHAYDPRFERDVAVKVMPREFLHDPTFRARFEREAKTIAALEHAAIVPVHDFGEEEGQPYLVMRYMSGGSLATRLRLGPISLEEAAAILLRIGSALDRAHESNIIHRDIKPSNILFDRYSDAFLSDFGIVKLTEATIQLTGSGIVGTPAYMAPEMATPEGLSHLIDVYALGVTLYQMLAGRLPYEAPTPMGIMMAHVTQPIPNVCEVRPDLPVAVQTVVEGALAKDPLDRYQSTGEMAAELRAAQSGQLVEPTVDVDGLVTEPVLPVKPEPSWGTIPVSPPQAEEAWETLPAPPEPGAPDLAATIPDTPPAEATPPQAAVAMPVVAEPTVESPDIRWLSILLLAVGWIVGQTIIMLVTSPIVDSLGRIAGWAANGAIGAAIAGLFTGLALRLATPTFRWKHILVVMLGWVIVIAAAESVLQFLGIYSDRRMLWAVLWGIGWALGGLVTGLALRWAIRSVRWSQILVMAVGWGIASAVGGAISRSMVGPNIAHIAELIGEPHGWTVASGLLWAVKWGTTGAIGGWVTGLVLRQEVLSARWRQVLAISGGAAIVLAAGTWLRVSPLIEIDITSTMRTIIALALTWAVGGLVAGLVWRPVQGVPILVLVAGWAVGGAIAGTVFSLTGELFSAVDAPLLRNVSWDISRALGWAVGAGIGGVAIGLARPGWRRQALAIGGGWLAGGLTGGLLAWLFVGDIAEAFDMSVAADVTRNIVWPIAWGLSGLIAGAIASGTMFSQIWRSKQRIP